MSPPSSMPHNLKKKRIKHEHTQGGSFPGNLGTRFPLNVGIQAKFWLRITRSVGRRKFYSKPKIGSRNAGFVTEQGISTKT